MALHFKFESSSNKQGGGEKKKRNFKYFINGVLKMLSRNLRFISIQYPYN